MSRCQKICLCAVLPSMFLGCIPTRPHLARNTYAAKVNSGTALEPVPFPTSSKRVVAASAVMSVRDGGFVEPLTDSNAAFQDSRHSSSNEDAERIRNQNAFNALEDKKGNTQPGQIPLAANGGGPISLTDSVRIALNNNKHLAVVGYIPQEVHSEIVIQDSLFDPQVGVSARGGKFDRQISNFISTGGAIPSTTQKTDFRSPINLNQLSVS